MRAIEIDLRPLALGHEGPLLLGQPAARVQKHACERRLTVLLSAKMLSRSETTSGGRGVMISGSRPTMIVSVWWRVWLQRQIVRLAHDHEAGDLIDRVVHPVRLEGGAVAAFVPAAVGRRAVEHAVDDEEGNRGPSPPEIVAEAARHDERREPDQGVADRRAVLAPHQLLEVRARDRRRVPFRRREPGRDSLIGLRTDEAVIASDGTGGHSSPPPKAAAHKPTLSVTQLRLNAALVVIVLHPSDEWRVIRLTARARQDLLCRAVRQYV